MFELIKYTAHARERHTEKEGEREREEKKERERENKKERGMEKERGRKGERANLALEWSRVAVSGRALVGVRWDKTLGILLPLGVRANIDAVDGSRPAPAYPFNPICALNAMSPFNLMSPSLQPPL